MLLSLASALSGLDGQLQRLMQTVLLAATIWAALRWKDAFVEVARHNSGVLARTASLGANVEDLIVSGSK